MHHPHWFKHAIIYHILIDRFAGYNPHGNPNQPVFLGGNLNGILNKLPYLKKLGINTLWISPFYKTSAYHGYHITDFNQVDPHFGSEQDLKKLIDTVHHQNMHIIADFVPNHCSIYHPFFQQALFDKHSSYRHWFYFTRWPHTYRCFLSVKELPKINLKHPPAREHILNAAKKWLNLGLDGYRLDHVIGPAHQFWNIFTRELKKDYPHIVLIGEAWMKGIRFTELKQYT